MVHVFSGCGMSRKVADLIGDIPGTTGFVMPVYGWRVPKFVRSRLREVGEKSDFCWAVFTCGDSMGYIDRDLEAELGSVFGDGFRLAAVHSVIMPETYLGLPGFRLDSAAKAERKLAEAEARCAAIRQELLARVRRDDSKLALKRGPLPWLLTNVIGRFFDRFLVSDRLWKVDAAKCMHCGRCAQECPTGDIELDAAGLPRWKRTGKCSCCFRCYHACRGDAIEYGPFTRGKGRLSI